MTETTKKKRKSSGSIRLSKEFGINPGLIRCEICGEYTGEIGLFGTSYKENGKTAQVPIEGITIRGAICPKCKKIIEEGGVFFIEVRKALTAKERENPYRTGRLVGVKRETAVKLFTEGTTIGPINFMENDVFKELFGEALKQIQQDRETEDSPKK